MRHERRLSGEDRDALALRLEQMKRQALEELAGTTAADQPASWAGIGEVRTHADEAEAEREQDLRLAEAEIDRARLEAIEKALQRLAEGCYGLCIDCGLEIARERLLAQPFAIRCAACQSATEAKAPGLR